jgi:hypothetical protein
MVAITAALVYYARVTIIEGKKTRKLDSYERQLVNLFNPMKHILSRAKPYTDPFVVRDTSGKSYLGQYQKLLDTDVEELRDIIVKYGHYLGASGLGSLYDRIDNLLFFEKRLDSDYLVFPMDEKTAEMCGLDEHVNWIECFVPINERQKQLARACGV